MSLDYPFYEELVRRRHRGALWWRVGDACYYLGLLGGLLGSLALLYCVGVVAGAFGFLGGAFVFVVGTLMKRRSYVLAARDGIHVDDF